MSERVDYDLDESALNAVFSFANAKRSDQLEILRTLVEESDHRGDFSDKEVQTSLDKARETF